MTSEFISKNCWNAIYYLIYNSQNKVSDDGIKTIFYQFFIMRSGLLSIITCNSRNIFFGEQLKTAYYYSLRLEIK